MKYSYDWLQSHIAEKLPDPETLKETIIFHAFEVESVEAFGGDHIFDIKVLPDRAADALSHYGMAREIAGLCSLSRSPLDAAALPGAPLAHSLDIQSAHCRRYVAVEIDGVRVGESPAWLKERLESIGQKSINNIVDAANFVMFDTGQPIHVFDAEKIEGDIVVRAAGLGEEIITLSGESKTLSPEHLVVADRKGALAIAGVKGGARAEVSAATRSIVIEIANFDATSVRKTARALSLPTDAVKRFENKLSPELATLAAGRMLSLALDLSGGTVRGAADYYPNPETPRTLSFSAAEIARVLGEWVTGDVIASVFDRYGYEYERSGESFALVIPFWRPDILGAHDVAEEVGRVSGYENIPEIAALPFVPVATEDATDQTIRAVRGFLLTLGFSEVMTYVFRKKGAVAVAHGVKGKDALRDNLSDGLLESFELNRRNMPVLGITEIKIFEIGTVFLADREEIRVATISRVVSEELPLSQFIQKYWKSDPEQSTYLRLPIPLPPFRPWSAYPFIARDISVWLKEPGDEDALHTILSEFAAVHCVRAPQKIDSFEKDGRTSVAYRLVFQSFDHTLTEEEVSGIFAALTSRIASAGTFEIR